jgi:FlaA1/EpsC-like NDP-sugar epimerase
MIRLAGYTPETDIRIEFTGLRPGEKLYEELLNQKETTMPTSNKKIMVARVREFDYDDISKEVDELIATTRQGKPFTTVKLMKQLVPEFISNNSIYEQLDPQ